MTHHHDRRIHNRSHNQDRRMHERVTISTSAQLWALSFRLGTGKDLVCAIVEISKAGLCAVAKTSQQLEQAELNAARVILYRRQGATHKLQAESHYEPPLEVKLSVVNVRRQIDSDQLYIHCSVRHDESRAIIWNLLHEAKGPRATEITSHTSEKNTPSFGKIPDRGVYTESARQNRLKFIESISGHTFETIRKSQLKANRLAGNIENHIGGVEVPLGLAGPLLFNGKNVSGPIYAPFATSEGALVASASRGSLLLSESGGVTTRIISQRMIRVPMFVMDSLDSALFFSDWLKHHVNELQQAVNKVSSHARLMNVDITLTGRVIHASFVYSTGDAAGQNMTTAATWHACQWALSQAKFFKGVVVENFLIDSGLSGDKKVNFKSFIEGRGTKVVAEAFIPGDILQRVMKVSPHQLVTYYNSGLAALIQAGTIGSNINVANTIAAIFTATGQDIACVHESSLANLYLEEHDGGVYATMMLPSLIVGTVGGGAGLPMQSECLKMLDCFGAHKSARFAEIIGGFCLALDLSTMSALVNGTFVKAHERLGRNRPVQWFKQQEISEDFLTKILREGLQNESILVSDLAQTNNFTAADSIITELTARNQEKFLGLYPYKFHYQQDGVVHEAEVIVKSKPMDLEVILLANKMAGMCSSALGDLYDRYKMRNESNGCHLRELAIYRQDHPLFVKNTPKYYGSYQDDAREAYVVVIDRIQKPLLIGKPDQPELWKRPYIEAAIRGMAELHSIWYGKKTELQEKPWIGFVHDAKSMAEQKALMREMIRHASIESPLLVSPEILRRNYQYIDSVEKWWLELSSMGQTLIHNDFNPRNIAITGTEASPQLCIFDWELATIQVPQHDLAEFLTFVTGESTSAEDIADYVELHRSTLSSLIGSDLDKESWRRGYELCLQDLAINRIAMYLMAHTFKYYNFMDHIVTNNTRLINIETKRRKS